MDKEVGFIGLGNMGLPMARNLLRHGFRVRVYNRSKDKARELTALGALVVDAPADTVLADGVAITMVSDDQALRAVAGGPEGLCARLRGGGLHISMSTVSPDLVRQLAAQHGRLGATLVSAPVSGRPEAAEAASLTVWLAGAEQDRQRARQVLGAIAGAIDDVGVEPAAANVAKLAVNLMVLSSVEMLAEALKLAERGGVDPRSLAAAVTERLFPGPVLSGYGARIANGAGAEGGGFKVALALKDIDLVVRTASASDVSLPFAQVLHQRLKAVYALGLGERDVSALALDAARPRAAAPARASER